MTTDQAAQDEKGKASWYIDSPSILEADSEVMVQMVQQASSPATTKAQGVRDRGITLLTPSGQPITWDHEPAAKDSSASFALSADHRKSRTRRCCWIDPSNTLIYYEGTSFVLLTI